MGVHLFGFSGLAGGGSGVVELVRNMAEVALGSAALGLVWLAELAPWEAALGPVRLAELAPLEAALGPVRLAELAPWAAARCHSA